MRRKLGIAESIDRLIEDRLLSLHLWYNAKTHKVQKEKVH